MQIENFHGTIVAKRSDIYSVYVFQLDNGDYKLCTVLPGWGLSLSIGDSGYASVEIANTGDTYINKKTLNIEKYKSDNIYLKDFIRDTKSEEIIL